LGFEKFFRIFITENQPLRLMKFIQGQDRNQTTLFPVSLEQAIDPDNEVRIIDLFVDSLPLKDYGFKVDYQENGRPAYRPEDLLKLFIYGYLNKVRSTRDLEKEARRNIEVMWLLGALTPDHNTIFRFKEQNKHAIKKVFRATVQIARNFELIGGKLIAGDSTRMRAQNSKKNNFNQAKIDRQVAYIENKLQEYHQQLEQAEKDQDQSNRETLCQAIALHQQRKNRYKDFEQQLKESGEKQISVSDADSRMLMIRNNINEVAYNVQSTVDAKHNLLIDYKVTNQNDSAAMGAMVRRAKTILGTNSFIALYDKGYHSGPEFQKVDKLGVTPLVSIPAPPSTSQAPDPAYNASQFTWDQQSYTYTCPQGHTLTTTGTWHKKRNSGGRRQYYLMQQFKTQACKSCPVKSMCTKNPRGRLIERTEYTPYMEQNRRNIEKNKDLYRKRQAIVEHPFGVMKRQWGFYYVLSKKGMARASADVGFIFIAYNLRRIINILGLDAFRKYLKACLLKSCAFFRAIRANLEKNYVLTTSAGIHTKNIKYLINTFIFGNNLGIPAGL
jgi:transposase